MNNQLTHIRLLVNEFSACFRFYRDILGYEPVWGNEDGPYADFDADGILLALFDRSEMASVVGRSDYPEQVECQDTAALILKVDNVDLAAGQLQAAGVELEVKATDHPGWGIRTAHLRDPDGNLIEIYEPLDDEE